MNTEVFAHSSIKNCHEIRHEILTKSLYAYRLCSPNSADLNPVEYVIWSVMQECVYQTRVHEIDELRQRLITIWCELKQRIVADAIDQWRRRLLACVDAEGGHFEHSQQAYKLFVRISWRFLMLLYANISVFM